jgi:Gas vesicle synthesis protein GvpL/GvpF
VTALYLYGVTRAPALPRSQTLRGISLVRAGDRAAIVSQVDATRPSPREHADVLEEVYARTPVLPARVGTTLPNRAVIDFLAADELGRLLDAHRDTAELSLEGAYDEELLVELSTSLTELRDVFRRSPSPERRLALGRAVADDLLAAELSPPLRLELVGPLPPYSFVDLSLPIAVA